MTVPETKSGDSPFTQPEMEKVDYGAPPVWLGVLSAVALLVAVVMWGLWWLA